MCSCNHCSKDSPECQCTISASSSGSYHTSRGADPEYVRAFHEWERERRQEDLFRSGDLHPNALTQPPADAGPSATAGGGRFAVSGTYRSSRNSHNYSGGSGRSRSPHSGSRMPTNTYDRVVSRVYDLRPTAYGVGVSGGGGTYNIRAGATGSYRPRSHSAYDSGAASNSLVPGGGSSSRRSYDVRPASFGLGITGGGGTYNIFAGATGSYRPRRHSSAASTVSTVSTISAASTVVGSTTSHGSSASRSTVSRAPERGRSGSRSYDTYGGDRGSGSHRPPLSRSAQSHLVRSHSVRSSSAAPSTIATRSSVSARSSRTHREAEHGSGGGGGGGGGSTTGSIARSVARSVVRSVTGSVPSSLADPAAGSTKGSRHSHSSSRSKK